jgi:hypothetical protein
LNKIRSSIKQKKTIDAQQAFSSIEGVLSVGDMQVYSLELIQTTESEWSNPKGDLVWWGF